MPGNKDSTGVVNFLVLFAKLKNLGDEPAALPELAKSDEAIKELCSRLSWAGHSLKMNERRHRQLFTKPVDPEFLTEWRDFEERFESVLLDIEFAGLSLELGEPSQVSKTDFQWETADEEAGEQAGAIEGAIDFAYDQAIEDWHDFEEGFRESIEDGKAAWERLKREVGFDLRGVFRRRELIPFTLIPRQVAAGYGSAQVVSLFKNLQQAHDAFIFGAPLATIGLLRSVVEVTLGDHYQVPGKDLKDRINNARTHLPPGASEAFDGLRKLSNTILHLKEKDGDISDIERAWLKREGPWLEKKIVWLLYAIRKLIEGVPPSQS